MLHTVVRFIFRRLCAPLNEAPFPSTMPDAVVARASSCLVTAICLAARPTTMSDAVTRRTHCCSLAPFGETSTLSTMSDAVLVGTRGRMRAPLRQAHISSTVGDAVFASFPLYNFLALINSASTPDPFTCHGCLVLDPSLSLSHHSKLGLLTVLAPAPCL